MKLGLVLEGGACHCAFQAGAVVELSYHGIRFYHVTGVSAGALNACAIVLNLIWRMRDIWRSLAGSRVVDWSLEGIRWNWSPFNMSRITFDILVNHFPAEDLARAPIEFAIVTTRLPDFRRHVFTNRQPVDIHAALRASNLIPVLHSRPVAVDGAYHIDGGFVDNVPVDVPLAAGCDRVLAIVNNPYGHLYRNPFTSSELSVEQAERIHVLHPPKPLPMRKIPFDFRLDRIEETFELGRQAARDFVRTGVLWA